MAAIRQTALITGTSRGIGPHIARAMAKAGYNLVLASRSGRELEALAKQLTISGAAAVAVPTDVTDPGALEPLSATSTCWSTTPAATLSESSTRCHGATTKGSSGSTSWLRWS